MQSRNVHRLTLKHFLVFVLFRFQIDFRIFARVSLLTIISKPKCVCFERDSLLLCFSKIDSYLSSLLLHTISYFG